MKSTMTRVRAGYFAGLLALAFTACQPDAVPPPAVPEPTPLPADAGPVTRFMADPLAVARGEALFVGSCAGYCHALDRVNGDALFLFDCEWQYGSADEEIFDVVTRGIPNTRMVGFGDNFPEGADDVWRIIAFLRTRQSGC